MRSLTLGAHDLSIAEMVNAARDPGTVLECAPEAKERVRRGRMEIDEIVTAYRAASEAGGDEPKLDYGVTTGFGEFKRVPIEASQLLQLQKNIILSHSAGVGITSDFHDLSNYYHADVVRAALLLRINAFLQGHSGVTEGLVDRMVDIFNKGIIPLVPLRGSVGSSGDLCPLSHLALVLFAEGREKSWFYQVTKSEDLFRHPSIVFRDEDAGVAAPKACAVRRATHLSDPDIGIEPHELREKEGLALTNGATFSAAMLALSVFDIERLANTADVALALSLESARGCARAFDSHVHGLRKHEGQGVSAANVRSLVTDSKLVESASEVQDPYCIRCGPAVHGAARDALAYAKSVTTVELGAATDNPLFFGLDRSWKTEDEKFEKNWDNRFDKHGTREAYRGTDRRSFSAGNFHGEPIGFAADLLAIAVAELANISERRTQFLMDSDHNRGLPPNLVPNAGLNSGFMIAQYCAAGLVSENKILAHPASVDSIPTSSNSEDHNAMATIAAIKLRHVLAMAQFTVAIELMVAAQAAEWAALLVGRVWPAISDGKADKDDKVANYCKAKADRKELEKNQNASWSEKRDAIKELADTETDVFDWWTRDCRAEIEAALGVGTRAAYHRVRLAAGPLVQDKVLAQDIGNIAALVGPVEATINGSGIVEAVNAALAPVNARLKPSHTYSVTPSTYD